jgi:hypothetical protein
LPVWKKLLDSYRQLVQANGYDTFHALPCLYAKSSPSSLGIMKTINKWLQPVGIKISKNADD